MTAGAFYRRMAGGLLLWALLPLPFLYIVMPPFWMAAGAVGLALVLRPSWSLKVPPWVLNLTAVGILVAVVAAGGIRVGPLRPLGHLLLLLTAVRVSQITDRKSFLGALPVVFLVWVVALTASTHVAALLYFVASAVLWWWAGMETVLTGLSESDGDCKHAVRPGHALVAALVAVVLAAPVFVSVPRLRSPWISGRGGVRSVTGFSSRVDLSGVGSIQESQERVLVVRSPDGVPMNPQWMRLRATAFERVTVGSWAPRPPDRSQSPTAGVIRLRSSDVDLDRAVALEIQLDRPREYVFVPEGAVAVEVSRPVRIDPAGGVVLASPGDEPMHYTAWVLREGTQPDLGPPAEGGVVFQASPEIQSLASRMAAGTTSVEERARAIERALQNDYSYSLTGMQRFGPDPVSWFLLRSRSGHCEYFAGGMTVLMNTLGDVARMVGGYSGGSLSANGEEAVVRESHAHTWVEVWMGSQEGWKVFDPTPAANVPRLDPVRRGDRLRFAWEWVQAGWDRYVLTFGVAEQMQLLTAAGDRFAAALMDWQWRRPIMLSAALATIIAGWWGLRGLRRRLGRRGQLLPAGRPAARAMGRLARRLERVGVTVPDGATIRWIGATASRRWPAASRPTSDLVWLAEHELYAEDGSPYGSREVRGVWSDVLRAIRRS